MMIIRLTTTVALLACAACIPTLRADPGAPINYFGQTGPGLQPTRFAYAGLGIDAEKPRIPVFSADGSMVIFNMGRESQIYISRRVKDGWSAPERAPFSNLGRNWEPYLLPDQKTLLFGSTRPPGALPHTGRIWRTQLQRDGTWSTPELAITTGQPTGLWYPTGRSLAEIYFSAELPGGRGADVWRTDLIDKAAPPVRLAAPINSDATEWDPYVLPDGRGMLFASDRPGGFGRADLYVAFLGRDGRWSEPRNLGPLVNSTANEVASAVSPDGRFLFFIREPGELFWVSTDLLQTP